MSDPKTRKGPLQPDEIPHINQQGEMTMDAPDTDKYEGIQEFEYRHVGPALGLRAMIKWVGKPDDPGHFIASLNAFLEEMVTSYYGWMRKHSGPEGFPCHWDQRLLPEVHSTLRVWLESLKRELAKAPSGEKGDWTSELVGEFSAAETAIAAAQAAFSDMPASDT